MSRKYLPKLMDKKGCKPSHEFFLFANRYVGIRTDVLEDGGRSSVLLTFESQTGINLSSKESFGTAKSNNPESVRPMCLILLPAPRAVSALLENCCECRAQLRPVLILKLFRTGLLECLIVFIFRNESSHLILTAIVYKEMWPQTSC